MADGFDQMVPREALAAVGRDFHSRGWMAGTAGNLSVRCDDNASHFWVTSSSLPKGGLGAEDMIRVDVNSGEVVQRFDPQARPSAETSIHQTIYQLFPDANACLHVHTVDACIATERTGAQAMTLRLPPLEMIKGLGVWEQNPEVDLPLFDNILEVPKISASIKQRFEQQLPDVPALMIKNHGITVWGETLQQAYNRVEIIEFIMSFLARR